MSLLEFSPVDQAETSYCIQELNGRLIYGSREEVNLASQCDLLRDYPQLDKDRMHLLEHALSREDIRRVFCDVKSNKILEAYDVWQQDGTKGIWDYVTSISENSRFAWPIAKFGNAVKQVGEGFMKMVGSSEENAQEIISKSTDVLNWGSNWIRCIACSSDGRRLAVCQSNDYIRVYLCERNRKAPITLKHPQQREVTSMEWKPYDQFALAVSCSTTIIVWRFAQQKLANRISPKCAQVFELPSAFCPATQCIWDHSLSATLFVVSPISPQILIMDTVSGEMQSMGSWFGNKVRRVYISPDGSAILVTYFSNVLKVYNRDTWNEESWGKLRGECVSAVWSPDNNFFLFACAGEALIRAIRFVTRGEILENGDRSRQRCGLSETLPIYDIEKVEQRLEESSLSFSFGGIVRDMQISPDGQRLAVSFKENCSMLALFLIDDKPKIRLTPCGLISGQALGDASLTRFLFNFSYGSLLGVVWSKGIMQYIPLLYGTSAEINSKAVKISFSSSNLSRGSFADDALLEQPFSNSVHSSGSQPGDAQAENEVEQEIPELFTSSGLYDRLLSKASVH